MRTLRLTAQKLAITVVAEVAESAESLDLTTEAFLRPLRWAARCRLYGKSMSNGNVIQNSEFGSGLQDGCRILGI